MSDKLTTTKDPIDVHVGARLKARRVLAGFSQEKLAEALGVTFQQVQKYENGANRVGASRLFNIGEILGVGVGYFFEGYGQTGAGGGALAVAEAQSEGLRGGLSGGIDADILSRKETLDLLKAYYGIEDAGLRAKVLAMIKNFG